MSYICSNCIGEEFLRKLASAEATDENRCAYCDNEGPTVEIEFIAERCDAVIETFYELTSQTTAVVHFGRTPAGDDLSTIIQDLTKVHEGAVEDVLGALGQTWFDRDSMESKYGEDDPWFVLKKHLDSPMSARWRRMENSLRNEARHLNPVVAEFMAEVFGDIAEDIAANGEPVLVSAGPGFSTDKLFRAREFQSERRLYEALHHPEKYLGAPAVGIGPAGRMNAAGQPAFYGATDAATALAEIRPAVGSHATVATFAITRPLALLDLSLLMEVQLRKGTSLFDPLTKSAAERRDFLKTLCEKMVMPVVPESQEHNYLITQIVADYLSLHPRASIDGIIYPSVQRNRRTDDANAVRGRNVVLFHKAATTLYADSVRGTASAQLYEFDHEMQEESWCPTITFDSEPQSPFRRPGFSPEPALQLVRDSIRIHRIKSVDIFSEETALYVGEVGH